MVAMSPTALEDVPRLRGVLHVAAFPLAVTVAFLLAWYAPTPRAAVAGLLMAGGWALIFGASSMYHRWNWRTPQARRRARQVDHAMIFAGSATSYASVWLIALDGPIADAVLVFCVVGALAGMASKLWFIDARVTWQWLQYLGFTLVGLVVVPSLWEAAGPVPTIIMLAGGAAMALGSVAFATGRPKHLVPGWVGHHEVFHAGTIVGAACHIGAVAMLTVR